MASHKTLKSVAASLAQSFTSLMNHRGDDYVMGHIVFAAWKTGATTLRVDLLTGAVDPSPLLVSEIRASVAGYVAWLPDMVLRSSSSMEFISAAELSVTVDPTQRRLFDGGPFFESPFICVVRIEDDRGKVYRHEIRDWWYPEREPPVSEASTC